MNAKRGGFGLYLSKRAVIKLGGHISLQETSVNGSSFKIDFQGLYIESEVKFNGEIANYKGPIMYEQLTSAQTVTLSL